MLFSRFDVLLLCCREKFAKEDEMLVDMGSDQTSLHNPYNGGYYPAGMSFDEANQLMTDDPGKFKEAVQAR
jgi:urocanate hydratase